MNVAQPRQGNVGLQQMGALIAPVQRRRQQRVLKGEGLLVDALSEYKTLLARELAGGAQQPAQQIMGVGEDR